MTSRARFLFANLMIALCLLLALPVLAAEKAEFPDIAGKLVSDDFGAKIAAVEELGKLGDPRAVALLKALADGRLYAKDGVPILFEDGRALNPATGERPAGLTEAGLDKVRVNNRLRGVITAALSQLTLFSPDRGERLNAARDALKSAASANIDALKRALAAEKDGEVRGALQQAIAAGQLNSGAASDRIAAIEALSGSLDPQVRGLLTQVVNQADAPAEVKSAAQAALSKLETKLQLIGILENLFQGVSLGSVLLLAAVGLAITFGVMGVINMAHGEMIMLGAYTAYVVQELFRAYLPPGVFGLYLLMAIPVAFLFAGAVGVALERSVIRLLYGRPLETMLATWGLSLMLQQAVRSIFGAPNKEVANPGWMTGGFDVMGGFFITWNRLYIIVFCFMILAALAWLLRRTAFGLHMRAVTQNRGMANAMGIPTARVDALTFGLGSGIAGMAGVALSQIGNVSPNLGQIYIVDSFLVVVFGGVGNLMGTLVGAMTLGIVNKFLEPMAGAVLGKVVVLIAIILFIQKRPRGLFALKGRAADA